MRKISFYLILTFIITSCDSKEDSTLKSMALNNPMQLYIINGDIEYYSEITDGSKPKPPIFVYDIPNKTENATNATAKTSGQSTSIDFGYGIGNSTKSGCTVKVYNNGNSYYTDAGVFGPNPYSYPYPETKSYAVRGYGQPHLNNYYGALILFVSNKGQKENRSRGIWHDNTPNGSAISIEYPFKANVSYDITIKATFYDNRYSIDKVHSSGYPTLYVQLKNDGIITGENLRNETSDPCDRNGTIVVNNRYTYNDPNFTRSYTLDSPAIIQRTLVFKFSPTEEKNALLLSLHPTVGIAGYETPIPTNNYTVTLPLITITEKEFDPSINTPLPNDIPLPREYNPRR